MAAAPRYRIWARSLLSPEERLLPGLGARLARHPALAVRVFVTLRRLPTRTLRAAAYRHVAVPLSRRMTGTFRTPVAGGVRMPVDLPSLNALLLTAGVWEWYGAAVFRQLLRPGDVFVDVGANIGYYAVLGSRLVGERGQVLALEPAPETYARLIDTLALNDAENVTALQVAAGAAVGQATLHGAATGHDEMSTLLDIPGVPRSRRPEQTPTAVSPAVATPVSVEPLHALIPPSDAARVALVKIDVEGYEAEVLRGLEPIFARGHRPALLIEVHADLAPDGPQAIQEFAARNHLRGDWIVDDEGLDYRYAPADRPVELRDLGTPPDLALVPGGRYLLVLTSAAGSPALAGLPASGPLGFEPRTDGS